MRKHLTRHGGTGWVRGLAAVGFMGVLATGARPASADDDLAPQFSLGVGYTSIQFEHSAEVLGDQDGIHVDPYLSFSPVPPVPQVRLGLGLGVSVALDDVQGAGVSGDDGLIIVGASDVTLTLFQPELRLAWRQPIGAAEMAFVEVGGAVGGTVGWLDVDEDEDGEADGDDGFNEHASSAHARGFLRIGAFVPAGVAGVEASYLRADELDFADDVGGELEQFYVGIFGALQF